MKSLKYLFNTLIIHPKYLKTTFVLPFQELFSKKNAKLRQQIKYTKTLFCSELNEAMNFCLNLKKNHDEAPGKIILAIKIKDQYSYTCQWENIQSPLKTRAKGYT